MNTLHRAVSGLAVASLLLVGCSSEGEAPPSDEQATSEIVDEGNADESQSGDMDNTESELILSQVIEGEDIERRAIVMLPGDYDPNTAYAIVLGFHGNGQSPEDFAWMAQRVCSFELPCIAVVPEGYKRSWNLGVEESTADDVAFESDVIAELSSQYPLTSDFFAIGHSNGSGLVHVLATETSLLKGIAGFGSMLIEGREPSAETSAVSVLQVHGMDDDVIPYDGGDSPVGLRFVPAEQSATLWGSVNGCDAGTGETEDTGDRILMFEGCVDDHRVLHYGLAGQGHDAGMSEEFALIASEFFASVR